jgi:hypothetical protein
MALSRTEQIKFARHMILLIERTRDIEELDEINNVIVLFQSWVKTDDNSVAYDLGEYAYESLLVAKGQQETGWKDQALKSLRKQLDE